MNRDIALRVVGKDRPVAKTKVGDVMTAPVQFVPPGSFVQDHWTLCQAGWGAAMRTPNSLTDNDTSSLPPLALVSGHQDFDFCVKSLSF
jgi:hypothetical protein